jgi:hypothetical protein
MELVVIKKEIETAIVDPVIKNEARRYSVPTRLAFLPHDVIGHSWYFRLLTFIYYYMFVYFHGFESKKYERYEKIMISKIVENGSLTSSKKIQRKYNFVFRYLEKEVI